MTGSLRSMRSLHHPLRSHAYMPPVRARTLSRPERPRPHRLCPLPTPRRSSRCARVCSKPVLLAIGALIGFAGSVAFGSASQLVARFPAKCGQALALGIVAAGPTVLLLQALLRVDAHPTQLQQDAFFLLAALAPLNAVIAVAALLYRHWTELQDDRAGCGAGGHGHGAWWDQDSITESMLESGEWGSPAEQGSGELPLLPAVTQDEVSLLDLLPASLNMPPMMQQGADVVLLLPEATPGVRCSRHSRGSRLPPAYGVTAPRLCAVGSAAQPLEMAPRASPHASASAVPLLLQAAACAAWLCFGLWT